MQWSTYAAECADCGQQFTAAQARLHVEVMEGEHLQAIRALAQDVGK
jgi:hypothetical protein